MSHSLLESFWIHGLVAGVAGMKAIRELERAGVDVDGTEQSLQDLITAFYSGDAVTFCPGWAKGGGPRQEQITDLEARVFAGVEARIKQAKKRRAERDAAHKAGKSIKQARIEAQNAKGGLF